MRAAKLLIVALLGVGALMLGQLEGALTVPAPELLSETSPQLVPTESPWELSEQLNSRWMDSLGTGEWLHISSQFLVAQEDLGTDPETGRPLPNLALWEIWLKLDAEGRQITYLARQTDLERGNVSYVAWEADTLLRLPSGVHESTEGSRGLDKSLSLG